MTPIYILFKIGCIISKFKVFLKNWVNNKKANVMKKTNPLVDETAGPSTKIPRCHVEKLVLLFTNSSIKVKDIQI